MNFAEQIDQVVNAEMAARAGREQEFLKKKAIAMLQDSIRFYQGVVDKLQRMEGAFDEERWEDGRVLNDALRAEHELSISVVTGAQWNDARFVIVDLKSLSGATVKVLDIDTLRALIESERPTISPDPSSPVTQRMPETGCVEIPKMRHPFFDGDANATLAAQNEGFSAKPCPGVLFGEEGWGVYTPRGELVAVAKGQARCETLVGLIEQAWGVDVFNGWARVFEEALAKHPHDHDRAVKAADEWFAGVIASDAATQGGVECD